MKIRLWKIGCRDNPASQAEIDSFRVDLDRAIEEAKNNGGTDPILNLVTHHAVVLEEYIMPTVGEDYVAGINKPPEGGTSKLSRA